VWICSVITVSFLCGFLASKPSKGLLFVEPYVAAIDTNRRD